MLLFCTTKIFDRRIPIPSRHPARYHRSAKCETVDIGECMNRLLPSDCSLMAIAANGVVGQYIIIDIIECCGRSVYYYWYYRVLW